MLIIYVLLWNIKKQPLISFHPRRAIRMIARWRVFAAENWMATIYTSLDVVVLSWISGEVATGLYSAAWKIVRLGSAVAKSYTTAIYPVMSRIYSQSKIAFAQLYQQTIRVMCALSLPAIAVITVIPDRVVELLYNDEYVAAAPILRILIWVLFIDFLNPFLSHALFAKGKQHRSMHVAGISLAVNAIATYLLVSGWGAIGAAMGTLIGGVVAMCCYLAFTMSRSEIVEVVQTATRIAAAATGVALSTYFLRDYSWVSIFCVSVSVYLPLLFLVGAFSSRDLDLIRNSVRLKGATS
jgi:O-antigen/teichoic acid export membrane protein